MSADDQLELIAGVRPNPAARAAPPLSLLQRQILVRLRGAGRLTSTEVGVMVHAARSPMGDGQMRCGFGAKGGRLGPKAVGCCAYASADGLEAMKRLLARGLVVRDPAGGWAAA